MSFSWTKNKHPHQASRGCPGANGEAVGFSIQYAGNEIDTSPPGPEASNERKTRRLITQENIATKWREKKHMCSKLFKPPSFLGGEHIATIFSEFFKDKDLLILTDEVSL